MRVLVVEDDRELADVVAARLRRAQWAVDVAYDGETGLDRATQNDYDVIVLDRDLPVRHGDDVCAELVRGGATARVLMLTASGSANDVVGGLDLGVDDYLSKPFDFPVLITRVRALSRRAETAVPPVLQCAGIVLDGARRTVTRKDRAIDLTPKEFAVLELLMAAQGRTISAEELLERVWDEHADPFTTAVKITISRLRAKLGLPEVIHTVTRAGYRVSAPSDVVTP